MSLYKEKLKSMFEIWDNSGQEGVLSTFITPGAQFAVYGAGKCGRNIAKILKCEYDSAPVCFIDKNARTIQSVEEIDVISPAEAFREYDDILVGIAVADYLKDDSVHEEIYGCLKSAGFSVVQNISPLDPYHNHYFDYMQTIDREKTLEVVDLLHDSDSKEQYLAYIYQRMCKTKYFATLYPESASYSATDLFDLGKDDHILDCGAYTGDTIKQFLCNFPAVKHITAFEPDIRAVDECKKTVSSLSHKDLHIEILNRVVSNSNGNVNLDISDSLVATRVSDEGLRDNWDNHSSVTVSSSRIDDIEYSVPPSLIKMDIEGAEADALRGAEKMIREYHPILAISLYHKVQDIYEIPLLAKELYPGYCMFFRKYSSKYSSAGFQMFAVPRAKLI